MNGYAATATYIITDDCITDEESGWDVMSTWESPIMQKHADIVCANGGHILEFGFGMGISADMIQAKNPTSHTIIEINDAIYTRLEEWASDKSNVVIVKGDWYNDIPTDKKYDGIFYDAHNDNAMLKTAELKNYIKPGGVFTYYNEEVGPRNFSFKDIEYEVIDVESFIEECKYFKGNKYYLPIVNF